MLEILKKNIENAKTREAGIHLTREFFHLLILKILFENGYFRNLSFTGGTALRILYDLRRFSEDLVFSLINKKNYSFPGLCKSVVFSLKKSGFSTEANVNTKGTVQSVMLKFNQLLFQLGLSEHKNKKLFIKIEVDTRPPKGWDTAVSLVSNHFIFSVTHFDLPSLYATKLHACFFRKYVKGRDFYDLLWYMGKKVTPNFTVLNNAILQTEKKSLKINKGNFNSFLRDKISSVNFQKIIKDVEVFIEDKNELKLLDRELVLKIIDTK